MICSAAAPLTKTAPISCLFLDIGGVLLTDGWGHHARRRAAETFELDWDELETRHRLNFATHEEGKLTLEEYLRRVVFHQQRPFTPARFRRFMFAQSQPHPAMLKLLAALKAKYGLKIIVISNEARELNAHRIGKFKLDRLVDAFLSSCFVHLRKPDTDIFRLALDLAQTPLSRIVYIENTPLFVEIATSLGIPTVLHTDYQSTSRQLAARGLEVTE